jgi:hypothetical protein
MFTKGFGEYVCDGDTITCVVETLDGIFDITATVYHDADTGPPDENQDGFWPSRDPKDAGYVKPEHYDAELEKAERVMKAWRNDEWHYCGVSVTVAKNGVELVEPYSVALWGIEMNYPGSDNSYLTDVANERIDEAMAQARAKLATLCADSCGGIRETTEESMVAAHKAGLQYWKRNKPRAADSVTLRENIESLARSCGWHGADCDSFVAGVLGAKRREEESR